MENLLTITQLPPPHIQSIHVRSQHRKPHKKLFQYQDHQLAKEEKHFATTTMGIKHYWLILTKQFLYLVPQRLLNLAWSQCPGGFHSSYNLQYPTWIWAAFWDLLSSLHAGQPDAGWSKQLQRQTFVLEPFPGTNMTDTCKVKVWFLTYCLPGRKNNCWLFEIRQDL